VSGVHASYHSDFFFQFLASSCLHHTSSQQLRALQSTGLNADVAATLARALRGGRDSPIRGANGTMDPARHPTYTGPVEWGGYDQEEVNGEGEQGGSQENTGAAGNNTGGNQQEVPKNAEEILREAHTRVAFAAGNRFASTETVFILLERTSPVRYSARARQDKIARFFLFLNLNDFSKFTIMQVAEHQSSSLDYAQNNYRENNSPVGEEVMYAQPNHSQSHHQQQPAARETYGALDVLAHEIAGAPNSEHEHAFSDEVPLTFLSF